MSTDMPLGSTFYIFTVLHCDIFDVGERFCTRGNYAYTLWICGPGCDAAWAIWDSPFGCDGDAGGDEDDLYTGLKRL